MVLSVCLADKKKNLEEMLGRESRVAVAFSGGVDSTLLLKVACDVLGHENTMAVFADTPLLPPGEAEEARKTVNHVGSRFLSVSLDPLSWPDFIKNPPERCYLCKKKIYEVFREQLNILGFLVLMDGTNLDDLSDYRPGLKALGELDVKTPLVQAGLTKDEIRKLSREFNLPNWNKHSSSCLATRVTTGQQINRKKLEIIKNCENFLQSLDFWGCRVRLVEDSAIIELQQDDIPRFVQEAIRQQVLTKFNDFRIEKILLDMKGRKMSVVKL
jgi:uncharacterized protein